MWVHLLMFNYISSENDIIQYQAADVLPDLEEADTGMCVHGCEPCEKWETATALRRFLAASN